MSLIEAAMDEMKAGITDELERRLWERLQPKIHQALHAKYMTVSEAADYLHVSEKTVSRLLKEKAFPSFRIRHRIFIRQVDIDMHIDRQIAESTDLA